MCDPVTAILGGSAAIGGVANIIGGSKASSAQASAANQAAADQRNQYNQSRNDLLPFFGGGYEAQQGQVNLLGLGPAPAYADPSMLDAQGNLDFRGSPGYQFRRNEGLSAIDASAASRGNLFSGATMKAAQRYGDGLAAADFDTYFNRLGDLANRSQNSATQVGAFGSASAARSGNFLSQAGDATASGILSISNGISGLAGAGAGILGRQSGFAPQWRA